MVRLLKIISDLLHLFCLYQVISNKVLKINIDNTTIKSAKTNEIINEIFLLVIFTDVYNFVSNVVGLY